MIMIIMLIKLQNNHKIIKYQKKNTTLYIFLLNLYLEVTTGDNFCRFLVSTGCLILYCVDHFVICEMKSDCCARS